MEGLIPRSQERAPDAMQSAVQGPEQAQGDESQGTSPEEQALYTKAVDSAYQIIYSDQALPKIRDLVKSNDDHIGSAAQVVASTMMRIQEQASDAGEPIPSDVMLPAMQEVFTDFADMLAENEIADLSEEQMSKGWLKTVDTYRQMEQAAGLSDQEGAAKDMEYFKEAESAGAMGQVFPELGGAQPAQGGGLLNQGEANG